MKNFLKNIPYFLKESKTIFKVDFWSNVFSILSIGLIFFILAMVICGWWVVEGIVETVEKETEISVYFDDNLEDKEIEALVQRIKNIQGIRDASIVHEEESYNRMVDILGKEAHVLEYFDDNPFTSFIEVKIHMGEVDQILKDIDKLEGIQYIRDNRQIINRLENIVNILKILGSLLITAVSISTIIVISHIIRQGIYNNKEEITTLELLGAPNSFIGFPFLLEGVMLTFLGGLISTILIFTSFKLGYNKIDIVLPFIPLASGKEMQRDIIVLIISFSLLIGILGSIFGLKSINTRDNKRVQNIGR